MRIMRISIKIIKKFKLKSIILYFLLNVKLISHNS